MLNGDGGGDGGGGRIGRTLIDDEKAPARTHSFPNLRAGYLLQARPSAGPPHSQLSTQLNGPAAPALRSQPLRFAACLPEGGAAARRAGQLPTNPRRALDLMTIGADLKLDVTAGCRHQWPPLHPSRAPIAHLVSPPPPGLVPRRWWRPASAALRVMSLGFCSPTQDRAVLGGLDEALPCTARFDDATLRTNEAKYCTA